MVAQYLVSPRTRWASRGAVASPCQRSLDKTVFRDADPDYCYFMGVSATLVQMSCSSLHNFYYYEPLDFRRVSLKCMILASLLSSARNK